MAERDPRWPADAPTDHLDTVDYWRGLYGDAIKVGQEMLAERDRYKAALERIARPTWNATSYPAHWTAVVAREALGDED